MSRTRAPALAAVVLGLALAVGGCGFGDAGSSADAAAVGAPEAEGAAPADAAVRTDDGATSSTDRRIERTAEIAVKVDQLAAPAARIRQAAVDLGGFVSTETTGYAAPGDPLATTNPGGQQQVRRALAGQSVLVLRIPEPRLALALDRAAAVGTELSRSSTAEDVTGDLADLTSRTATQRASVARVRQLLAGAKTLQEIVLLESELTKRESELEALQARLATLADRADMAALTVVMQTAAASAEEPNGFVRGLRDGWDALVRSATVLITLLGALLPFALLAAVVGTPLRRRRRRSAAPVPDDAPTPSVPTPAP